MINGIFLLLGSNMGDRKWYLDQAKKMLNDDDIRISRASSLYLSPPWDETPQPYYLNQVLEVETDLHPELLLAACLKTETQLGRIREKRYGQRTIDIDILYYHQLIFSTEILTLPHPRIQERRFVLVPMSELAPGLIHPVLGQTQKELLSQCTDVLPVRKLSVI